MYDAFEKAVVRAAAVSLLRCGKAPVQVKR
jgi:hypothetical protein